MLASAVVLLALVDVDASSLNRKKLESGQASAHRSAILDEALSVGEAGGSVARIWKKSMIFYDFAFTQISQGRNRTRDSKLVDFIGELPDEQLKINSQTKNTDLFRSYVFARS